MHEILCRHVSELNVQNLVVLAKSKVFFFLPIDFCKQTNKTLQSFAPIADPSKLHQGETREALTGVGGAEAEEAESLLSTPSLLFGCCSADRSRSSSAAEETRRAGDGRGDTETSWWRQRTLLTASVTARHHPYPFDLIRINYRSVLFKEPVSFFCV